MFITHWLANLSFTTPARREIVEKREYVEKVEEPEAGLLFQQAVADGWNLEYDWLWLASRLNSDERRNYCYRQALRINPHSDPAKLGLKGLKRNQTN